MDLHDRTPTQLQISRSSVNLVTVPGISGAVLTDTSAFFGYAVLNDGSVRSWGTAEDVGSIDQLRGIDLISMSPLGDRLFVRGQSGEVFGLSPSNSGGDQRNGNPTASGNGPYRVLGP